MPALGDLSPTARLGAVRPVCVPSTAGVVPCPHVKRVWWLGDWPVHPAHLGVLPWDPSPLFATLVSPCSWFVIAQGSCRVLCTISPTSRPFSLCLSVSLSLCLSVSLSLSPTHTFLSLYHSRAHTRMTIVLAASLVQVFVEAGNEAETIAELELVADALLWIADLRVIVVLVLDRWDLLPLFPFQIMWCRSSLSCAWIGGWWGGESGGGEGGGVSCGCGGPREPGCCISFAPGCCRNIV